MSGRAQGLEQVGGSHAIMKLRRSFGEADESLQIFKRSVTVDPGPDGRGEGPNGQGWGSRYW